MKKHFLRILIVLIGVAGLGITSKGQGLDRIEVKVPSEFVVAGKTFPAGTYMIHRLSESFERALVLSNRESGVTAFILVSNVGSRHDDNSAVSFEQAGDKLLLRKIQTTDHVFTISVSRSGILEATSRTRTGRKPA